MYRIFHQWSPLAANPLLKTSVKSIEAAFKKIKAQTSGKARA